MCQKPRTSLLAAHSLIACELLVALPFTSAMQPHHSLFGPLESVRVFPDKNFAFVNYASALVSHAGNGVVSRRPEPVHFSSSAWLSPSLLL